MHLCGDVNTQAMVVADGISSLGGISNTEIGKVCENQPKACLKHCDQKMTIGNMKKAKLKSAQEGEGYILNNAAPEIHIGEIIGGGNIVGNQGEIYMQIHMSPPPKPNLLIQPSDEHISAEQRLALKKLVYEWVALHNSIKKTPLSYGSAWARTNEAARATSYSLILKAHLCKAIAFVQQEMAKLRSMRSAPTKDDKWRQKRIAAIKARSKSQLRNADAYKPYIKKAFNADSLSALSTDELQKTYAYIMKKKAPEL
jgi:hypothetical protein